MTRRTMQRPTRRGFTVTELVVAAILLTGTIAVIAQTTVLVGRQQQTVQRRLLATQELSNVMEQVATLPYDEVSTDGVAQITLSHHAVELLTNATLQIDVQTSGERAKRVAVSIDWENRASQRQKPLKLVAWRYEESEVVE